MRKIIAALRREVGGWWFKVWGGPFQQAGIPDIVGCCRGLFFALEVKVGRNKLEKIQIETIERIREDGEGIATEVRSVEQALKVVRDSLAEVGRLSMRSSRTRTRNKNTGRSVRSGNWKDIRGRRRDGEIIVGSNGHLRWGVDCSFDQQDNDMAKVHRNPSAVTQDIRAGRRVRDILRSQGDITSSRSVRNKKREETRR